MPSYLNIAIFFGAIIGFSLVGLILYQSLTSNLRPFFIVGNAWKTALLSYRTNLVTLLIVVLLIASGRILQRLVNAYPVLDEKSVLVLSIVWQASLNMLLAMAAISIHMHVIEQVKIRYGLEDFELRNNFADKLFKSALYGVAIWAIGWATLAAARYVLGSTTTQYPAMFGNFLSILLWIQASLLMLVRPAYSLELKWPFLQGIHAAIRSAPTLLVIQGCLAIPIMIYNVAHLKFISLMPQNFLPGIILGDTLFVLFSTLQFLAIEAAAVMLIARLELSRYVFKKTYG